MFRKVWTTLPVVFVFATAFPAFAAQGGNQNRRAAQAATSASTVELQGVVESITMGFGQGTPSFSLSAPGRGSVLVYIGSYRAWTQTNFELKTGMSVTVSVFQSAAHPDGFKATEIKDNVTGATVRLMAQQLQTIATLRQPPVYAAAQPIWYQCKALELAV